MFLRKLFNPSTTGKAAPSHTAGAPALTAAGGYEPATAGAHASSFDDRADALDAAGRHPEALAMLDEALARAPDDARLHYRRGTTLYRWNRVREARDASLRAAELGLSDSGLFRQIGWSLIWTFDAEGAERWMARAVETDPGDWRAHFGWGTAALAAGRADDALARFTRAAELEPTSAEALNCIVVGHLDRRDSVAAEAAARQAIAVDDRQSMAWANLGVALARQRRFDEAEPPLVRALELEENERRHHRYVRQLTATSCAMPGAVDEAIALYERLLPSRPNVNAHSDYAFTLMLLGRLPEGWREYEFRWLTNAFMRRYPNIDRPVWNGQSLQGRTILLWVEQGFGDTIQFIRYAPLVKALGATVLVLVREGLEQVIGGCAGIDRIVNRDEELPPFDFHLPLMSLPRVFGTDVDSIPAAVPYLRPMPEKSRQWREQFPPGDQATRRDRLGRATRRIPTISIARYPSPNCARYSTSKASSSCRCKKGLRRRSSRSCRPMSMCVDLAEKLGDFGDTAAVIDDLDLVICVDTSVAHLAGALGKPTWVLLPHPCDFRWLESREDSPWYPTARLFRQDGAARMGAGGHPHGRGAAAMAGRIAAMRRLEAVNSTRDAPTSFRPLGPVEHFDGHREGFSAFARARYGLLQYLPDEPVEGVSIGVYGEYREAQLDFLSRLVSPGSTVMEVMPGIGAHTIAVSRMIGPAGTLLAVEPRKIVHRILRQNLATNGAPNTTLLYRGLGEPAFPGAANAKALLDATVTGRVPETDGAVDTIDGLRLARLNFLKINEGADVGAIFAGAAASLWQFRPLLYIAVPRCAGTRRRLPVRPGIRIPLLAPRVAALQPGKLQPGRDRSVLRPNGAGAGGHPRGNRRWRSAGGVRRARMIARPMRQRDVHRT